MSETIYYESINYVCLTDCPHGFQHNVGSGPCEDCKYFVEHNEDEGCVECDYVPDFAL